MNDSEKHIEQTNKEKNTNVLLGSAMAVALATAAFFSGIHIGSGDKFDGNMSASLFDIFKTDTTSASTVDMTEFWQVWNLMDEKFVTSSSTSISAEEKIQGAISGLVSSFKDPYSVYLPPKDAEQFMDDISGNFGGVGMEVGMRDNLVTVISPLPDTPAYKAGILSGDIIVEIDGVSTKGISVDDAVEMIRGEKGTDVVLKIYREGSSDFITVAVTRDTISIPTIKTDIKDDVFTIALYNFNAIADTKMQEALNEFLDSKAEKLILDLRGNPGGFLQSAISISGYFLPAGKVVVREGFGYEVDEKVYRSAGKVIGQLNPDNFVVLVNGGSASAAEILAGALKEHEVATVIGETTFGKGSVQELIDLKKDGSLKITIARWLTPNGTSISEGGLEPNLTIDLTTSDIEAGTDTQMEAALDWLDGVRVFENETVFVQ